MMRWIELFAGHRIAANGAMILIAVAGLWGINQVNNQFFPDFEIDRIIVSAQWSGVSPEDMYQAVGLPLQQALLGVPELESVETRARDNNASLSISISDRAESLASASDIVEELLSSVNLPDDVSDLTVFTPSRRENVADILIYGDIPRDELAGLASDMQQQLLQAGFAQINLSGIPNQAIEISIPMEKLLDTGLTLSQISNAVSNEYTAQPGGTTDSENLTLQLRSQTPNVNLDSLYHIPILTWQDGSTLKLGDIANIERIITRNANQIYYQGVPAIRLQLLRTAGEDTLENADAMQQWLADFEPTLPPSVKIHVYNQTWQIVASQLQLLYDNGALGMVLVIIALFLFLNARLAFWVALGIPISFLATFLFMSQTGTSLNTISLFGFMIALGIIVDDAIVVGEQTRAYQQMGIPANEAALKAAKKMWPPVLASSLTTIAAFYPLTFIGGPIGRLAIDIPIIVTIAIVASLIECFLILPGHLSHSKPKQDGKIRQALDAGFNKFRDQWFRPVVRWSLHNRSILSALIIANLIIALGLVTSRTVPFQFQPSVESPSLSVTVAFADGVDSSKVNTFVEHLRTQLQQVEDTTGYDFIKTAVVTKNQGNQPNQARIDVELTSDQNRPYTNQELVNEWRKITVLPSEIESISFGRGRRWGGESGDITVQINGDNIVDIKNAALALQNRLNALTALSDASDDLPFGDEQLQFSLTPLAMDVGVSEADIATFMRHHLEGVDATSQIKGLQTFEVTVLLPAQQRSTLSDLLSLPYRLPSGELVPLEDLMNSEYTRGLDQISASDGVISAKVFATLDSTLMTSDEMYAMLTTDIIPVFSAQYGTLDIQLAGDAREQQEFFADTLWILLAVLALIYGILAWVFESWVWPLAILITIPFGLIGAIYGHWLIDLPLSSLSVLGLFGLSGIVINDSIVLVSVYRDLRNEGLATLPALEEAVARRLRPVILTTLTTMAGLTPLLFETSLDAEFLKPIAAGLVFGLMFGTTLILLFVPTLLYTLEQIIERFQALKLRMTAT